MIIRRSDAEIVPLRIAFSERRSTDGKRSMATDPAS
jgi:hypothetical protein